jgi:nicotinamidase/pyrazinamidase
LNRFAAGRGIPVVSTADAHAENDPEFREWPPHCIAGTLGQRKAESTLLEGRIVVPNRECELALNGAPQIIVEKQTVDVFQCRNLGGLVDLFDADRYIVYGVVTEICVLYAARGLAKAGKHVTIVSDAVASLSPAASARALEEVRSLGGAITTVGQICP